MAHEITATDYMVSGSNTTPWHGLGAILPGRLTAIEALAAAKLDWTIQHEPVFDGDMKEIATHKLNRRVDTKQILGVVRKDWEAVQNIAILEIAEALAQVDGVDFQPVIETAGSLRGGGIVWALVRTGERKFADSVHYSYLLISNGHDGLRAIRGTLTDVRVVCANTLRLAEASASLLYVSHAKGVNTRLKSAVNTLGWANDATRATFAIYEALASTSVHVDLAHRTFRRLLVGDAETITTHQSASIDKLTELFRNGRGNAGKSAFDLLNAATDWADHVKGYRQDEKTAERRFVSSSMGGEADRIKASAYRAARDLAGV